MEHFAGSVLAAGYCGAGAVAAGLAGDAAIPRHGFIDLCIPCTPENHPLSAGTGAGVSGWVLKNRIKIFCNYIYSNKICESRIIFTINNLSFYRKYAIIYIGWSEGTRDAPNRNYDLQRQ